MCSSQEVMRVEPITAAVVVCVWPLPQAGHVPALRTNYWTPQITPAVKVMHTSKISHHSLVHPGRTQNQCKVNNAVALLSLPALQKWIAFTMIGRSLGCFGD